MVFEILVLVGDRFLLALHVFCVSSARIAVGFREMRAVLPKTHCVWVFGHGFEILVFVGDRFLLALLVFCVPCARIAAGFR